MTIHEIERTLGKDKVNTLLGSDDPRAAIVLETDGTDPQYNLVAYEALVDLYALVYTRVSSRRYDGE